MSLAAALSKTRWAHGSAKIRVNGLAQFLLLRKEGNTGNMCSFEPYMQLPMQPRYGATISGEQILARFLVTGFA